MQRYWRDFTCFKPATRLPEFVFSPSEEEGEEGKANIQFKINPLWLTFSWKPLARQIYVHFSTDFLQPWI